MWQSNLTRWLFATVASIQYRLLVQDMPQVPDKVCIFILVNGPAACLHGDTAQRGWPGVCCRC